ncbi:Nhl domain-containing protein [Thalictrum thalictroides]|uniref:Nhl domain-containing protein n=1 Tax=Thalictrum thalictroides TaxID=46969 RepID=A0A7J6V9I2_THATH|nr:Nhl domain-containing protein [Thalictrum thalictroides]
MRNPAFFLLFLTPFIFPFLKFQTEAAPAVSAPLVKHLSSILKWTRSSPKQSQTDGNVLQFENGYLVETVAEGNALGVLPYSIRASQDGELFAVDAVNSNIVRITPPLSQYSRARLVAGSFQGYAGHVDGKPSDARFNHPKGVTMDDKGNVYVADTSNLAIRKIGEAGVTTIAGGKSNVAGYRDGPSEDAKFSSDFDVVYVGRTCSLLVIDRGNAALRQISLNQEDCDNQHNSITSTDISMVIGAVLIGYASCVIQQGIGLSLFSRAQQALQSRSTGEKKPTLLTQNLKEDQDAGWSSAGRLIIDFAKLAVEALGSVFLYVMPVSLPGKKGLTPIKDSLVMPEDKTEPPLVQKQRNPTPVSEARRAPALNSTDSYTQHKLQKSKSTPMKDSSLPSKHRSSKRQEYTEFYGSGETTPSYSQYGSKSQKERTRHRHRDRSGEIRSGEIRSGDVTYGSPAIETKPVEVKPVDYSDKKYDHYNIRNKYGSDDLFNF